MGPVLGEEGLALMRYMGSFERQVKGACTGHLYSVFPDSEQYVDSRDARFWLQVEGGKPLFEEI